MPRQLVFPCPSCGASLSVDPGAATAQCLFCGTPVVVPAALRGAAPAPAPSYAPPPPNSATGYAPAAPYVAPVTPYITPIYNPVFTNSNRVWRSVIGLNLFITGAVVVLTLCITAAGILPVIVFMVPGLWAWLAQILSQLTSH
jgi:hypothetical protein